MSQGAPARTKRADMDVRRTEHGHTHLSAHCSSVHLWAMGMASAIHAAICISATLHALYSLPSRRTSGQRAHVRNAVLSHLLGRGPPPTDTSLLRSGWSGDCVGSHARPPSRAFPPTPLQLQAAHVRAHAGLPRALPCGRPLRQPPNPPNPPIGPRTHLAMQAVAATPAKARGQRRG